MFIELMVVRRNGVFMPMLVNVKSISRVWPDLLSGHSTVEMTNGASMIVTTPFKDFEEKLN